MRRIIIAYDGSSEPACHGGDSIASNLARFCNAFSNSSEQIVFYRAVQNLDLGVGRCLGDKVADGYAFIVNNYQPGDKLFFFGFSRGAFAARTLANFVAQLGVLQKRDGEYQEAMKAYKDGKLDGFRVKKIKPHESCDHIEEDLTLLAYEVEIEVVGCWDTVASLDIPLWPIANAGGVSEEYKHFDPGLVKGIKHAFHALALDECRRPFTPILWYLPHDPEVAKSIDLQQCWFPGAHNNVGGGYPDTALANISLAWMMDQCSPFLDFNPTYLNRIVTNEQRPGERRWKRKGKFDMEYQGWGCGMCYDSYQEGSTWTWKTRTPGAYGGGTNEMIHASARERWSSSREHGLTTGPTVWNPKALKGFMPRQKKDNGEWEWMMGTILTIPEAPFPTAKGFEQQLRSGFQK